MPNCIGVANTMYAFDLDDSANFIVYILTSLEYALHMAQVCTCMAIMYKCGSVSLRSQPPLCDFTLCLVSTRHAHTHTTQSHIPALI